MAQEEELNELLPFGEFMPNEGRQPGGLNHQMWMGLDAWELERLLSRLTSANQNNTAPERRRLRLRPRFRNLSLHPSGGSSCLHIWSSLSRANLQPKTIPYSSKCITWTCFESCPQDLAAIDLKHDDRQIPGTGVRGTLLLSVSVSVTED